MGPLGFSPLREHGPAGFDRRAARAPRFAPSGHLSMEIRPPPSEGKGGEVPLLHRPLSLLEQRGLTIRGEIPACALLLDSGYPLLLARASNPHPRPARRQSREQSNTKHPVRPDRSHRREGTVPGGPASPGAWPSGARGRRLASVPVALRSRRAVRPSNGLDAALSSDRTSSTGLTKWRARRGDDAMT